MVEFAVELEVEIIAEVGKEDKHNFEEVIGIAGGGPDILEEADNTGELESIAEPEDIEAVVDSVDNIGHMH